MIGKSIPIVYQICTCSTHEPTFLLKLTDNLNTLREREAKYGGSAPLELVNQIADHEEAITLTGQALSGDLSESEWREALQPLLIAIQARPGDAASDVTLGDIEGGIQHSAIAGRDVNQITVNVINLLGRAVAHPSGESESLTQALKELVLQQVGAIDPRTAHRYPQNPTGYESPLRDALTELLEADRGLAARLDALLTQHEQTQQAGAGDHITLSGTGNITKGQGNISVTATGGGITIGSVGGDVRVDQPARKDEER
jgi:hypothetical protein